MRRTRNMLLLTVGLMALACMAITAELLLILADFQERKRQRQYAS